MMAPALVVSPHYDDAVLSAGAFMAGRPNVTVLTVFGNPPADETVSTEYDRLCGFTDAGHASSERRIENYWAVQALQGNTMSLLFPDGQYGEPRDLSPVIDAMRACFSEEYYEIIVGPLGLIHEDHVATRHAFLEAAESFTGAVWLYEELPYRVRHPESVPRALAAVRAAGWTPTLDFVGDGPLEKKREAIQHYKSQLAVLGSEHDYLVPERFYRLERS